VKEMGASKDNGCTNVCLELKKVLVPLLREFELDHHKVNCLLGNVAGVIGTARDLIAVQLRRASECLGCLESCREIA
jgi:hypothetical protein